MELIIILFFLKKKNVLRKKIHLFLLFLEFIFVLC